MFVYRNVQIQDIFQVTPKQKDTFEGVYVHHSMDPIAALSKVAISSNPTHCKNQKKNLCQIIPQKKNHSV
jgi:hypothetical protein